VTGLLQKYGQHQRATLIGIYLREFTTSEALLEAGWLDLKNIKRLK
jgi:hypothetical protein